MFMVCISNSSVLRAVEPIFLARESIGILSDLVANTGIALDIGLQVGMVLHKFPVIYERRILANLLGNFAVVVKEAVELLPVPTREIAIPSLVRAVETVFLAREGIRALPELVTNTRIALQIGPQGGVVLHKFAVVYERRILANLLSNSAVVVEEAIELLSVRTCDIAIPSVPRQSVLGAVKSDFRPA